MYCWFYMHIRKTCIKHMILLYTHKLRKYKVSLVHLFYLVYQPPLVTLAVQYSNLGGLMCQVLNRIAHWVQLILLITNNGFCHKFLGCWHGLDNSSRHWWIVASSWWSGVFFEAVATWCTWECWHGDISKLCKLFNIWTYGFLILSYYFILSTTSDHRISLLLGIMMAALAIGLIEHENELFYLFFRKAVLKGMTSRNRSLVSAKYWINGVTLYMKI